MEPITSALSILGFAAGAAVLVATAWEAPIARLGLARAACLALCTTLVTISVVGQLERWALGLACVGALLSLQAITLTFGQLAPSEDPPWWPEFERAFRRYARRQRRATGERP